MDKPLLEIKDVHCGYDGVPVIHGISIEVFPGELVAVVGTNGAGKTTLMKTIAGLITPSHGRLVFKGEDITELPAHQTVKKGISYVPEGRRLFSKLTVRENLELGACIIKDRGEINARLDEMFDLFPLLKKRADQVAETMSGGEQQILAIARGLMSKPELLMLDEMSLGLMPAMVEKMMETIQTVHASGTTVLLVEQMVQEALEIAQRGYVIQTGQMVLGDSAEALLNSEAVRTAYMGM
ncbi:MAG: ABC transporter ATP-binding protein [Desulfobacterales bacterium]|nr:ABC transporter ATP-binding protein [Desulfobacterales bacterium]